MQSLSFNAHLQSLSQVLASNSGLPVQSSTPLISQSNSCVHSSAQRPVGSSISPQTSSQLHPQGEAPIQLSGPVLSAVQAPFCNYGYQNLGQSMYYYPCSPPLIPSESMLSPITSPGSIPKSRPLVQQEQQPSILFGYVLFVETFLDAVGVKEK